HVAAQGLNIAPQVGLDEPEIEAAVGFVRSFEKAKERLKIDGRLQPDRFWPKATNISAFGDVCFRLRRRRLTHRTHAHAVTPSRVRAGERGIGLCSASKSSRSPSLRMAP